MKKKIVPFLFLLPFLLFFCSRHIYIRYKLLRDELNIFIPRHVNPPLNISFAHRKKFMQITYTNVVTSFIFHQRILNFKFFKNYAGVKPIVSNIVITKRIIMEEVFIYWMLLQHFQTSFSLLHMKNVLRISTFILLHRIQTFIFVSMDNASFFNKLNPSYMTFYWRIISLLQEWT